MSVGARRWHRMWYDQDSVHLIIFLSSSSGRSFFRLTGDKDWKNSPCSCWNERVQTTSKIKSSKHGNSSLISAYDLYGLKTEKSLKQIQDNHLCSPVEMKLKCPCANTTYDAKFHRLSNTICSFSEHKATGFDSPESSIRLRKELNETDRFQLIGQISPDGRISNELFSGLQEARQGFTSPRYLILERNSIINQRWSFTRFPNVICRHTICEESMRLNADVFVVSLYYCGMSQRCDLR